jgi:murein DD-endopeptidase MepM/ murein hydrolase activator NlpD
MNASPRKGQRPGLIVVMISSLLVVTFLLAYYPQPAQASCAFKYTVQSGDTLYGIAATYVVTFDDLVSANKLKEPYLIYVGQVLCIPPGATVPESTASAAATTTPTKSPTITPLNLGTVAWVGLTNFPKQRIYYVNVYSGSRAYWSGPSFKIGMITTDKTGAFGAWFHLPSQLFNIQTITICVKDVINDDVLACEKSTNWDYYLEKGKAK